MAEAHVEHSEGVCGGGEPCVRCGWPVGPVEDATGKGPVGFESPWDGQMHLLCGSCAPCEEHLETWYTALLSRFKTEQARWN